jgi:hypothetical protein
MDDVSFSGTNAWRFVDVVSEGSDIVVDYRVLAGAPWTEAVTFEFKLVSTANLPPPPSATTVAMDAPTVDPVVDPMAAAEDIANSDRIGSQTVTPDLTHKDPWVWRYRYKASGGSQHLLIRIKVGKSTVLRDDIDLASPSGAATSRTILCGSPRLVLDINDTPRAGPGPADGSSEVERVIALMGRIGQSLARGLDETAWLGPHTGRGLSLAEQNLPAAEAREEAWARRVTEMFLVIPYEMSSTVYRILDPAIYDRMAARLASGQETFFPVAAECQQLSTLVLLARGVPRNLLGNGVNAGGSHSLPVFSSANQGAWHTSNDALDASKALSLSPPVGPASLYEFATPSAPNTGAAHIGAMLRVHRKAWCALQSFDTGGLNAAAPNPDPTKPHPWQRISRNQGVRLTAQGSNPLGSGTFDDPWVTNVIGSGATFSGAGVIGSQHSPPGNLAEWWPCGFARLMIRRRQDDALLYATPLLRMHDASHVYSLAALANSLRGISFSYLGEFVPIWQVSVPRADLARATMTSTRDASAHEILLTAGVAETRPLKNNWDHLFLLCNIFADPDEVVHKVDLPRDSQHNTPADGLAWGVPTGDLKDAVQAKIVDAQYRDFPPYLQVVPPT